MKRSPIARKRAGKPRRVASKCSTLRCTRRPIATGMCLTHSRAEADRLCSLVVRKRDGRCQRCGSTEFLEWSHHITRGRHAVRYDERNAVAHCRGCHVFFTHNGALHTEWIRDYIGAEEYERLMDRAYGPRGADGQRHLADVDRVDYASTIAVLRDRLARLEAAA